MTRFPRSAMTANNQVVQAALAHAVAELPRIPVPGIGQLRAPDDPDHPLRGKPNTDSGASRTPVAG